MSTAAAIPVTSSSAPERAAQQVQSSLGDTLPAQLARVAAQFPDRPVYSFHGRRSTYAEFQVRVHKVAGMLAVLGVGPGDRVGFLAANRPEYLELMFACAMLGSALVPFNTRYGSSDLAEALRRAGPKLVFFEESFRKQSFRKILAAAIGNATLPPVVENRALPELERVIPFFAEATDVMSYSALVNEATPQQISLANDDSVFLMIFTSGTSGFPKPVMQKQGPLIRHMTRIAQRMAIDERDVVLSHLSYFHVYGGIMTVLIPMVSGSMIAMAQAFDASETLALCAKERVSIVYNVYPGWRAWFEHPEFDRFDLSAIRGGNFTITSPAQLQAGRKARRLFGPLTTHFGMTETAGAATLSLPNDTDEQTMASAGAPLPGVEVAIVDQVSGQQLPIGQEGEICVRGEAMTCGYFRMPEETARTIDSEGWLHTGDLGVLDEDGRLCVRGRINERLRSGGENIDPNEVEAFLLGHPNVARCEVMGIDDERLGQVPVAVIVPHSSVADASEADVIEFCQGRIANFKTPKRVFFVSEFPGYDAKVSVYKLKELVQQKMNATLPTQSVSQDIVCTRSDGILTIALNRPECANAVTVDGGIALRQHFQAAAADSSVRAVVLTANGKHFCAGFDLRTQPQDDSVDKAYKRSTVWRDLFFEVLCFPKPFVVAANGGAVGLGCMLASIADKVVAVDSAYVSLPEIRHGWPTPVGYTMAKYGLSAPLAMELTLSARRIAVTALVNIGKFEVVAADLLLTRAQETARELAAFPMQAFCDNKAWIHRRLHEELTEAFDVAASYRQARFEQQA